MSTPIRQLLALITQSVETLEAACESSGTTIPDLHTAFAPPSEEFRANPEAAEAARIIAAAALQLEAIVSPPQVSLYRVITGYLKSTALRICLEAGVTEILREAGPQGMHVRDIAAKKWPGFRKIGSVITEFADLNIHSPERCSFPARFMRFLATHHVYLEVSPNVFTHTRISSILDTLKPSAEILADPEHKHDGTMGLAALASHHLDESFKASAYAWETLADPATVRSGDPAATPLARSLGRPEPLWTYFARPEEQFRQHRFNIGMKGVQALQPPDAILKAYNWSGLPAGSLVVDVGGGVGTSCLTLAAKFPELKFVVQDQEKVVEQGKELWNAKMPAAISSGQVALQVHDFFKSQPQTGVAVFLMKQIMHDWSDEYCVKILTQLSAAAGPETTLLLLETVIPLATRDPNAEGGVEEAPAPLLPNYGAVNDLGYSADMVSNVLPQMFLLCNSQERTRMHFVELLAHTGWKVVAVHRQPGDSAFLQSIEAKKVAV
ncbi:S-adenosyl-L-methionine-dependent methyltransferase [Mycena venus]|uniref:S-adenosyl-L-methionine-dependent methyltransferase n=1 Tax=Mycena venus TaxID=2733690 RepID=A0A8H7DCW4_9AGAR|nr:S-adenosyl-L-methionine-dependent methyltransferase [Mycena venus]